MKKDDNTFETREVRIGATNEKQATVLDGVNENEKVVLNLRQNLSLVDLPDLQPSEGTLLAKLVADSVPGAEPAANGEQPRGAETRVGGETGANGAVGPRGPGGRPVGEPSTGAPRGPGGPRDAGGPPRGPRPATGAQSQNDNSATDVPNPAESTVEGKSRSDLYLERIAAERKTAESGE